MSWFINVLDWLRGRHQRPLPPSPAPPGPPGPVVPDPNQVVILINQARARLGHAPVAMNSRLMRAATWMAFDLKQAGKLAHDGPGIEPLTRRLSDSGYAWRHEGEILAYEPTPEAAVQAWLNDGPHYDILIDMDFRDVGAAVAYDASGMGYFVVDFGSTT